jgi:hypothetical protein
MPSTKIFSVLFASALTLGQASAAQQSAPPASPQSTASQPRQSPLPPGPAASVREAQGVARPLLYWAAAGAVIIAGIILIAGPQDDDDTTTTTTGTGN